MTNHHSQVIQIKNIAKSCDCTAVEPSQLLLAPGEATTLNVVWAIGERRGPIESALTILYSLGDAPWRTIAVSARISAIVTQPVAEDP
jgi:hypothetical protein